MRLSHLGNDPRQPAGLGPRSADMFASVCSIRPMHRHNPASCSENSTETLAKCSCNKTAVRMNQSEEPEPAAFHIF